MTRLWKGGRFASFDESTIQYLKDLSVTHVWLTGIPRHASGKPFVKGAPGCPYSICDYFDINGYLAEKEENRIEEFKSLINRFHASGLKVLIDFVPNHVSPDYNEIAESLGKPLMPTKGYHDYDWSDTEKIDYDDPRTAPLMGDILRFWAGLGVDGFRCDMVELVPPDFFRNVISSIKAEYPETIFIAEVYQKARYREYIEYVGFDYLYDKSGLYDVLRSIYGSGASAREITWNWQFLGDLQPRMLNFLENHDEVRAASWEFAGSPERTLAALSVSALLNGAPMMVYFGQECGEDAASSPNCRTSIFDWTRVPALEAALYNPETLCDSDAASENTADPAQKAFPARFREIMALAALPVFGPEGAIHDLGYCSPFDTNRFFAWARYDAAQAYLVVANFSDLPAGVPVHVPACVVEGGRDLLVEVGAKDFSILRLR